MADAWVGIGVCEIELGNPAEAIQYLQQGLLLDNNNVGFLCLLANTYFLNNQTEKAKSTYEEALKTDPSDEETWLEYAEALVNMDDHNQAIELISEGLKTLPNNNSMLYTMAAINYLKGNTSEGGFFLYEAYINNKEGLETILDRFSALKNNNDFLNAIECLSK